ncbi:serine hydrolase [Streptomyces antimicrobicus]|uniref:Beta-lactamase family protein n=1 Tax=Streptomyces antimicrobicus TaxID=2883108 RepID=A0ABS8B9L5_9ACTN|nr:serine hydrolase domain-containing protein [Streptomyces antimicrobicus]MCB5181309.1 beta-lactamase family protein [Streptomyces antimicrobicus]
MTTQADRFADLLRSADAAWAVGDAHGTRDAGAVGPIRQDSPLDVTGLAAVLVLWPVVGRLVAEGELRLHTPLSAYWDRHHPAGGTTAHQLLTHTAAVDRPADLLCALAEHLSGEPLATSVARHVWGPLGMNRTGLVEAADGSGPVLRSTLDDLGRFLHHLCEPADTPVARSWIADSLRIRTGELVPARGLLWHPAPHVDPRSGLWCHGDPAAGSTLWLAPREGRWAVLLTRTPGLREAFRTLAFQS